MRFAFYVLAIVGFTALALVDLADGHLKTGVASLLLAVANALLLR